MGSRLWLTYAWKDSEEGDFAYLVQRLKTVQVNTTYDRIEIIPGRRLWDQIAIKIAYGPIDGWGYLITPNSLTSEACREELAYALDRALTSKNSNFPLIGLIHGVRMEDVPPPLRVRLCVNLASPSWPEEIKAGLEARSPKIEPAPQSEFVWHVSKGYDGVPTRTVVEIRPRFGEIMYWRFVVPVSVLDRIVTWGHGPANGGPISFVKTLVAKGKGKVNDQEVSWFGAGDRLSPSISAYVIFEGQPPQFLWFGSASDQFGGPHAVYTIQID